MQSIKDHLHRSGKHTADLTTSTNAPVTHETVKKTQEENVNKAVDREIHETHHQTEVLPVHHKEVHDTQHHENVLPVEHRQQHHGKDSQIKEKLGAIAGGFSNKQTVHDTQHVKGEESEIVGEHRHHHVHETVQPVIQQETIQPHVVHTTVPIHERVDLEPTVHNATVAKPMSMDQFKQQVGVGGGKTHETLEYHGDPLSINKDADVGFRQGGQRVDPSHHNSTNTGLSSGGGMTGGTAGGLTGQRDHHHSGVGSGASTGASAGATAGALAASQHNRDHTGNTSGLGHSDNTRSLDHDKHGQTIGSASSALGNRDTTGQHHTTHGDSTSGGLLSHNKDHTTGGDRRMPGGFDNDSSTHGAGHTTHTGHGGAVDPNATGFMDGRSPNDNKTQKDESGGGGLISGLINKMKS